MNEKLESKIWSYFIMGLGKEFIQTRVGFDVLDLILITSIFGANWVVLSWGSKFTKSRVRGASFPFCGRDYEIIQFWGHPVGGLSDFRGSLSTCLSESGGKEWLEFWWPLVSGNLIYHQRQSLVRYPFKLNLHLQIISIIIIQCSVVLFCLVLFLSVPPKFWCLNEEKKITQPTGEPLK